MLPIITQRYTTHCTGGLAIWFTTVALHYTNFLILYTQNRVHKWLHTVLSHACYSSYCTQPHINYQTIKLKIVVAKISSEPFVTYKNTICLLNMNQKVHQL